MNRKNLGLLVLVGLWFFGCTNNLLEDDSADSRPNILLIVADDLGYADMGAYGGDIETPNLDALAASGIRFSRFHTAPLCAVTRAMLLSGNNNHIAGMGSQQLQTQVPGYEGHLTDRIIPLPALLRSAGYHTYMAGKWHLGDRLEDGPMAKGFEHSFSINGEGAANHYSNLGIFSESAITGYTEDGEKADWKEGDYSTDFYTDKLISYIDRHREDGKPFFTFAAYTSPHWPLQVDEKYWKKYEGRYDDGYESLKEKRFKSLKKAGMIPIDAVLPKTHPSVKAWGSLSPEEQKKEARKMELYAGMVDNLDYNIGRLINYLKETGQYENTLIIFMSDNGAAAEDFYYHEYLGPFIKEHYSDEYSEMGKVNSFISYGPQWAEAGSSPFKYFKGFTTEGGINTPMIVAGPGVENIGKINDSFLTLMDFAPTFYELANVQYPNEWKGKVVKPLLGKSILPLLSGKSTTVHDSTYVFGLELEGYSMIRKGDWKIVNIDWPFLLENFQLMNLQTDLAEQQDLKEIYPEKYQEMLSEWERFSKEVGIVYPTPSPESN